MTPEELKKAPKLFCENIRIGFTPEYFVMGMSSGTQAQIYSLSPAHAKRLVQYLTHELKEFEDKHGEINATWNPNVVSPVQRANPPSELS
jgi:DNA replication protein DnaD